MGKYYGVFPCGVLGKGEPTSAGSLPNGIFSKAERCHDRTNMDVLAFNKPAGSIIDPDHWLHRAERDTFYSIFDKQLRSSTWLEA